MCLLSGMRTLLSRAIQADPTFHVGLGLIAILSVAEIFAATSYDIGRARAARVSAQSVAVAVTRPQAPSIPALTPVPTAAQPAVSPAAALPSPSQSLADHLVREGVELRDRGDTTTALERFDAALDGEPDTTAVLMRKGKDYDYMPLACRGR